MAKETPSAAADSETKEQAQAALDGAEELFLADAAAHFRMIWDDGTHAEMVATGAFDLSAPVARQTFSFAEGSVETRLTAGHSWTKVSGEDVAADLDVCWLHFSTGTGDQATASALLPVGLMLVEPTAVGFRDGADLDEIVVDLLLEEAASAMMPKAVNQLARPIDSTATVPGIVRLRDGQYTSLEFQAADVLDSFDSDDMPDELATLGDELDSLTIRVEYTDLGAEVVVTPPGRREVIDLGDRAEFMTNPAESDMGSCAAAR